MTRRSGNANRASKPPVIRCAIYTRKSSDEGLQQDFNSLDAQREAAEAYIASQKNEGWIALSDRYDDGGYTGGSLERPALRQLLTDIDAGKFDCVVVYKVDRLSRSLMGFAKIMETFDRHKVSFVSVTQHFNTTHSMGRLTLNILLSFAQFEREIIGERIRDKIAASRQKGKWTGGTPILGYDVDRSNGGPKLVVNAVEASRVRQIFEMYLEHGTLLAAVAELDRREWRSKVWTTRSGKRRGGEPIDKCRLHSLLTNVLYVGKITHKKEVYAGEHEAIIPEELFRRVQARLRQNRSAGCVETRNSHGALLRRLLYCKACGRVMVHTFACRGNKRYRYYTCTNAIKNGRRKCPSASLPAGEIEKAVVDQIRWIAQDPDLLRETLLQARAQFEEAIERLMEERRIIERGLTRCHAEIRRLATSDPATTAATARVADLTDQVALSERRLANDFVSDEVFDGTLDAWFGNMARVLKPGRGFYIWGGYANLGNYPPFLKKHGLYFSQGLVWDKQHPVLTRKDFMGAFEICFYGWKEGAGHNFFGPNNVTDLWHVKKVNPQSMVHLPEKPVELAIREMQYSSRPEEHVLDLFGGSGSTLIAAEQTGRRAFLMELDAHYCDVIVSRWEKFSGRKAERK